MSDDFESRWDHLWALAPFLLAGLTALTALTDGVHPVKLLPALVGAGWYAATVYRYESWLTRPALTTLYLVGALAVTSVGLPLHQAYFMMTVSLTVQCFMFLPNGWTYAGATAVTLAQVVNPWLDRPAPGDLPNLALGLAVTCVIGGSIRAVAEQSEQRQVALAELAASNDRLRSLAEENAALQAQLLAQAREAGVRGERERLAREIHDTIAQDLIGIVTQLEAAEHAASQRAEPGGAGPGGDPDAQLRHRLDVARRMAREGLAEARRSVRALRPRPLADAQLAGALRAETARWSLAHGIGAEVTVTGDPVPLHPEVEVTLLRTAQEALRNTQRHAAAGRVGVTLSYMGDVVALDVRDDGVGFAPGAAPAPGGGGFGLTAMRQRVTRLAGTLEIESQPGEGTGVSATLPAIPAARAVPLTETERTTAREADPG
ncbi:sensor histidine kinase [Streptomyces sp. DSM 44915]|uniref:Oxygen sensor histidine kinase NreB n=1 Tax=Streptomyces chisholmiae TaxID=3075540 RepID=A0ABU2JSS0_9ACTN|nr:sensor histidine kinase [Streptomyces sp. DSM 44915]MDT0268037.1 sensor histidine kinase [Streptomyces sp. DSM 44915]